MNKKELATVVVLILLIPVWLFLDARFIKPRFPDPEPRPTPTATAVPAEADAAEDEPLQEKGESVPAAVAPSAAETLVPDDSDVPPRIVTLQNARLQVEVSNRGAVVERVTLKGFPETREEEEPVVLEFAGVSLPALTLSTPGVAPRAGFEVVRSSENRVELLREVQPGLLLMRTLVLEEDSFEIQVTDAWTNQSGVPLLLPEQTISLGPMMPRPEASQRFGPFVGVDALHAESGVKHYVKDMMKGVKRSSDGTYTDTINENFIWFSVKNKFFTQVLTLVPQDGGDGAALELQAAAGEGDIKISMAQASARLPGVTLQPQQEVQRQFQYYVGPMAMPELRALGENQESLIDFRLFRVFVPLGKLMMNGLNFLHGVVRNWGVAIILLTFVVRMLFWPLTQKGAENMKRMSELSPQMKALREKYKNDPQKLNAEMSKFYKENKVNPMAGCLPMLVQIPVFISLYGVLRVAVELRFAEFLWIKDLSEPERLFMIGGFAVNILPLTMGATMVLQQRLTPSNMDEQQKKIMMMMPIVFLFITYSMPSGLLLYWTTSNLISIYQTTHTRKRDAKKAAAKEGTGKQKAADKAKPVKNPKATKK